MAEYSAQIYSVAAIFVLKPRDIRKQYRRECQAENKQTLEEVLKWDAVEESRPLRTEKATTGAALGRKNLEE